VNKAGRIDDAHASATCTTANWGINSNFLFQMSDEATYDWDCVFPNRNFWSRLQRHNSWTWELFEMEVSEYEIQDRSVLDHLLELKRLPIV
jgi:hypothetical protein